MRGWTALEIACASSLLLVVSSLAEETPSLETLREERTEELERYFVRTLTQKRLNIAIEFLEEGQYSKAHEKLARLNFPRLNPYERAISYRFMAYAAIGQEDTAAAIRYFQKVVEQQILPIDDEASVRFNIAQLYASIEEWEKVDETLQEWFHYVEKPNPWPTTCSQFRTTSANSTTRPWPRRSRPSSSRPSLANVGSSWLPHCT